MTRALQLTALAATITALMGAVALATCWVALNNTTTANQAIEGAHK